MGEGGGDKRVLLHLIPLYLAGSCRFFEAYLFDEHNPYIAIQLYLCQFIYPPPHSLSLKDTHTHICMPVRARMCMYVLRAINHT